MPSPRKKLQPGAIEQKAFVQFDPENVRQTVEIQARQKPSIEQIETVEKVGTKNTKTKGNSKKIKKPRAKPIKKTSLKSHAVLEERKLNPKGHILIITEKPQAASKIAAALSNGKDRKSNNLGVPYYELERNGKRIIVACAVGHLFTISQMKKEQGYPIFDIAWFPNFQVKKKDFTKKYYQTIQKLAENASEIVVASVDYNEKVPIMEEKEIKIVKIGEFIDDIIENKKDISKIKVPCFNNKGYIKYKNLKKAIRHKINEDLYEISLDYGRKVKLTSSHNVFSLKNKNIELLKTTELKVGDEILCPNFLPNSDYSTKEINLLKLRDFQKSKEIYVSGKDVSKILIERTKNKKRKDFPNNEERVCITLNGRKYLSEKRKNLGFSTKLASIKAKISQPTIVLWESGKRKPSLTNFKKYCNVLNINFNEFIKEYCKIEKPSFVNLLEKNYSTQFKNFSNYERAIIPLYNLNEEDISKIKEGFIYGSKNKRNKLPINLNIDKELVRIMGYFLAEGDINNDYRIRFSLGLKDTGHEETIINEIKMFCSKNNLNSNYYLHKKIKHQIITIDNCILASLFKNIFKFGSKATNKRIPDIIFNLPLELKKEFLRAYFLGDGSLSKNITFNSSSKELIQDLAYLMLQLGINSSIFKSFSKSSKSNNPMWRLTVSHIEDIKKIDTIWKDHHLSNKIDISKNIFRRKYKKVGNLISLKIKSIKKVNSSKEYVYDFSVEGENFIAGQGGICCHNTDFDTEGEVIGYNIVRFITGQKDAKRMKFSSLTAQELQESYDNPRPTIEWGQAIAGETRHFLDWLYGINLSRALMHAIKSTGKFKIMSIGRVQGPTLNLIVEREKEILAFISTPYWQVFITISDEKNKTELKYIKDIIKKSDLEKFKDLIEKKANATTTKTKQIIPPPAPFDLTTLQTEAYKFHGITPSQTLATAQKLYLAGLISYPRTSSQKIPDAMQPKKILKELQKHFSEAHEATRDKPIEGKKSDPAHPAVMPTGSFEKLDAWEEKIFNLIVKRFISCFCDDAELENKKIELEIDGLRFNEKGMEIIKEGWMKVYPAKMEEKEIKDFNGEVTIEKLRTEEKMTQPPRRYSPASIITELEKRNLGTKATRSNIIDTLYDRDYIKDKSIKATELGIKLIDSLKKHSPIIIDENLTRNIEKEMDNIRTSKKDLDKKQNHVLDEAKKSLQKISSDFKKSEQIIGKELAEANQSHWDQQKEDNKLDFDCPSCKKGKLTIKFSPRFRNYFIACTNYPECRQTYSLPSKSLIKKLENDKKCEECGFPMLLCLRQGKRPWILCFNKACSGKKPLDINGN